METSQSDALGLYLILYFDVKLQCPSAFTPSYHGGVALPTRKTTGQKCMKGREMLCMTKDKKNDSRHKRSDVTTLFSRFPSADNTPLVPLGLTAVGVAALLEVRVALQAAVGRRDVLGRAGDGRLRHDRVGLRRLVNGLELQPLVVDPQVGRLQVFGVALVLVGAVGRLGGGSLPAGDARRGRWKRRTKRLLQTLPATRLKLGFISFYFFWWDVVRRVHRKAPTTTMMTMKAPTPTMTSMTMV